MTTSPQQLLTANEVKKHDNRKSVWIVIRNEVYDVTPFLYEHPGGEDPLLDAAGQDATIAFEDVGHSPDAIAMMKKYKIGKLAPGEGCCKMRAKIWRSRSPYHRDCTECDASSRQSSFKSDYKPPATPRVERRVQTIVVPRERRPRGPPCGRRGRPCRPPPPPPPPRSSRLKWALLALGVAIIAGVVYKKYAGV